MIGKRQQGFTYLFVLLALTILSIMLLKSHELIQTHYRQQQEDELLFRGQQIQQAIHAYQSAPWGNGCFPTGFQQLLEDKRGNKPHFLLRRWFTDPMTGSPMWGMTYDPNGRWIGVHSLGNCRPLRKEGFNGVVNVAQFRKAKSYNEWTFNVQPDATAPLPSACIGQ
ncbi:type II secretion system protein [Enterobacter chuandaensis]